MVAGGRLLFKIAAGEERGMADMASRVRVTGPLARYSEGFGAALAEGGYAPTSVADQLRLMAHLGRWLAGEGLRPGDLTPVVAERFLLARRAAGYRRFLSARGVAPLMEYLVAAGVIVPVVSPEPPVPGGAVLAGYREYLVSERGLAPSTIRNYLIAARLLAAQDGLRLESVTAGDVTRFVLEQCGRRTGSATILVTGLRSLLRYLHLAGFASASLADAVPAVASASPLPRAIGPGQDRLLLRSCDRGTAVGLRDYAILVLLVRLGLRVSEVAGMELGDIDWRAGQVTIRGKGSRADRLPLPADAGQAIACWLRGGRPGWPGRHVFTTLLAPLGPLNRGAVSAIVKRAALRAGLAGVSAHGLRHGAATGLLRAGASLPEVGQVLRHASMLTTARYARVDHAALSAVARPWPGAAR
jgi:integrase/recombinase XerD